MSVQTISTSFHPPQWKYDVFLSFRGDDTRKGFTDHLYTALEQQGIKTFKDDPELQKGETISPALFAAIEESRFAIIILSKNYASSTWCLEELVRILECMRQRGRVLPIFYEVDPSDVRKQTGSFGEAFTNHEKKFGRENVKLRKWKYALTEVANFSGWDSKGRYEAKLIRDIVEDIWTNLKPTSFRFAENLVGMNSRLQPIYLHLGVGEDDVRFIGIWGMGGIGKTTMVRAVYERISHEFEFSFLLTDVRNSVEKEGLLNLQKQLLSGVWIKKPDISDIYEGASIIQRLLERKKVLIILDNVNHSKHINSLAGNHEWFGPGSRILITTRNEHLLILHGVERRLKVEELNDDDSLELFSWKAFKKGNPKEDFHGLSKSVISYAKGLPLALEVLGSSLYGRGVSAWKSALSQLGRVCNSDIFDVLEISYNDLDSNGKKIFLDIACFFNGDDKDRVTGVLTSCDFAAVFGIEVLMERALITHSNGILRMHELLQEMGRRIVELESLNELGRRSRLWLFEDVKHVLTHNSGTEVVEGIFMDSKGSEMEVDVTPKSFSKMYKLRYLKIKNANLHKGLEYLPNSLRILHWTGYPLKSFPIHFNPQKLFELTLCHSCFKHVQIGAEPLNNLKIINLSHSLNLVSTPKFKWMPYLEFLYFEGCIRLYDVDPGIEVLERLIVLDFKDCKNLVHFASNIRGLKSLEVLNLSGCSKVSKLPNDIGKLKSLKEFYLNGTDIKELPMSCGMPKSLCVLNLKDCKNLVCIPSSVGGLKSLNDLNLSGCSKLDKLPDELGHVTCLEKLDVSGSGIREVPSSVGLLKNLKHFSLAGCKAQSPRPWNVMFNPLQLWQKRSHIPTGLSLLSRLHSLTDLDLSDCSLSEEAMPRDFGSLSTLTKLYLRNNQFVTLPESIGRLARLQYLYLDGCRELRVVPDLPSDVWVNATNCISLDTLPNLIGQSSLVPKGRYINCFKLAKNENCDSIALGLLARHFESGGYSDKFTTIFVSPGNEIPEWYNHRSLGSSITLELHPGWYSNKFVGFAACAVFRVLKPIPPMFLWSIACLLTANEEILEPFGPVFGREWGQPVGDHILCFCTSKFLHEWLDTYYKLEFSFKPSQSWKGYGKLGEERVRVKMCGVRPMYEQDVEELQQTLLKQSNPGLQLSDHNNDDDAASSSASQARPNKRMKLLHLEGPGTSGCPYTHES